MSIYTVAPDGFAHDLMLVMSCSVRAQQSQLAMLRAEMSQTAGQLSGATGTVVADDTIFKWSRSPAE